MNADIYYKKEILIAAVDDNDRITGEVERWEAHRKGILHRGFTAILRIGDQIILQHRKHPAFDGYWDLTFSSHQIYLNGTLQTDEEAMRGALAREWNVDGKIHIPEYLGSVYYKAKDPGSVFTEHEVDRVYLIRIDGTVSHNPEFSYGSEMIHRNTISSASYRFAPWVEKILRNVSAMKIAPKG